MVQTFMTWLIKLSNWQINHFASDNKYHPVTNRITMQQLSEAAARSENGKLMILTRYTGNQ